MLTKSEIAIVDRLDKDLEDLGFPDQLEDVQGDWSLAQLQRLLRDCKRDVFQFHFAHVGESGDEPIYEQAEKLYDDALAELSGRKATPNKRVRVYDSADLARKMTETFKSRPVSEKKTIRHDWPVRWQHVGDSLAVAYSSDKWRPTGDFKLYKHLAESRNRAYCVPGFLRDPDNTKKLWPAIGPIISIDDVPMPRDCSDLALFEELDLQLHVTGDDDEPEFGDDESDGVVKVMIKHAKLGGGFVRWSQVSRRRDVPFLFVYTEDDGPLVMIFGDELDVLADGIVG